MALTIKDVSDEQLEEYLVSIQTEIRRRETLRDAEEKVREINSSVLLAQGNQRNSPWRQPLGAHDAYPKGWGVTHKGKSWTSNADGNVWEPGTGDLWTENEEPAPEPEPLEADPWEPGQAVKVGDLREYEGSIYSVVQAHTTQTGWEPPNVPALWKFIQ